MIISTHGTFLRKYDNSNFCLNYVKTFLIVLVTIAFHSHTSNPHCFSYVTITRCHHRKSRIRQGNCGLLPMIRRRLQKKPRMQPVLHDSVVKSYVFDLLELATKPFLLLPRNSLLLVSKQMDFEQQNVKHRTQICGNNCFVRFKVPG